MPTTRLRFPLDELPLHGVDVEVNEAQEPIRLVLAEISEANGERRLAARLRVEPSRGRIEIRGRLDASVPMRCSRCTDPFPVDVGHEFRQVLLRSSEKDDEVEIEAEELDASEFIGEELDLAETLREELLLALPDKPLCREDCRGICARCGAELNREACTCAPEVDPRWAGLKAWQGKR